MRGQIRTLGLSSGLAKGWAEIQSEMVPGMKTSLDKEKVFPDPSRGGGQLFSMAVGP